MTRPTCAARRRVASRSLSQSVSADALVPSILFPRRRQEVSANSLCLAWATLRRLRLGWTRLKASRDPASGVRYTNPNGTAVVPTALELPEHGRRDEELATELVPLLGQRGVNLEQVRDGLQPGVDAGPRTAFQQRSSSPLRSSSRRRRSRRDRRLGQCSRMTPEAGAESVTSLP